MTRPIRPDRRNPFTDSEIVKFWLDISKDEQAERLQARRDDPLKAMKISPLDAEAQKRWSAYSDARDETLKRTHTDWAPWSIVHTDKKKKARLNIIRHVLRELAPEKVASKVEAPDKDILFPFDPAALTDGRLEK